MPVTQASVVNAAARKIMKYVTDEVDANKDKKIDEAEVNGLMKSMDEFMDGGGPPSQGALPAERTRLQMAVLQTLTRLADDPKIKNADFVTVAQLRAGVKKTVNELIDNALKTTDGGLMNGLGGLMSLTMLPDDAVKFVQTKLQASLKKDE